MPMAAPREGIILYKSDTGFEFPLGRGGFGT